MVLYGGDTYVESFAASAFLGVSKMKAKPSF